MGRFFLYIVVIGTIMIMFVPIFTNLFIHADLNRKHLSFALYAYGVFKIVGGYISSYPGGIVIHLSDKKAVVLPYSKMDSERKRMAFFREIKPKSYDIVTTTGAEYILPVTITHSIINAVFYASGGRKDKQMIILSNGDVLRVSMRFGASFNLYLLMRILIKIIKEKIKEYAKKE